MLSSDARPQYKLFPPAVQVPERVEVQRHPGETPEQSAGRRVSNQFRGHKYGMWQDGLREFYVWVVGICAFTIEVVD